MKTINPWIVIKFGGTSVKDRPTWNHIASIIKKHLGQQKNVFVVCSAPYRVSNLLDKLIQEALKHHYQETLEAIKSIYQNLAQELEVDFLILHHEFNHLVQLCEGIMLLQEASPRIRAKIMAFGELMLTNLGFEFLQKQFDVCWQDARELLKTHTHASTASNYLSATCEAVYDENTLHSIRTLNKPVVITQGFIASNAKSETVLLGRGGSDTSAAYFATKLGAMACEIWTDVLGIYTANPHLIPEARLLKKLTYTEAQEIASLGAKVLHPLCIPPLKESQIPLHVKQTSKPDHEGTSINLEGDDAQTIPIKAIITRHPVLLISIESVNMWEQAGFLAEVFSYFKKHYLSVNLISTSETNITVSLDPSHHQVTHAIESVLLELNKFAKAKLMGPCTSISLIGREIRSILPQISQLFEVFASQQIYLLSQAANDLNLTFVVDEDQAERLAKKLHALLIEQNPNSPRLGKTWLEEHGIVSTQEPAWWQKKQDTLLVMAKDHSPMYVYDQEELEQSANKLLACNHISRIFYAMKANPHPDILKLFFQKGLNFECVSMEEVHHLVNAIPNIDKKRILFTPNFAPRSEYQAAIKEGILLTIDSLFPLQKWPELFEGKSLFIRIDPGHGSGHHKYVCTGGNESKFGIPQEELPEVARIAKKHYIKVIGLHAHTGSGILNPNIWHDIARLLTHYLDLFSHANIINIGGGFGIVEKPGQQALDLKLFNDSLQSIKKAYPELAIWIEPGRYLVATAGVLLAKVTQVKQKGETQFIGIETGMNSLIRPALYGSYHEMVNLSHLNQPKTLLANIVGPICESGDTLGYSRLFPETQEGDIVLIANVGAYGHCMSSHYNLRPPAEEFFLASKERS